MQWKDRYVGDNPKYEVTHINFLVRYEFQH
jgi:hypothetical protein